MLLRETVRIGMISKLFGVILNKVCSLTAKPVWGEDGAWWMQLFCPPGLGGTMQFISTTNFFYEKNVCQLIKKTAGKVKSSVLTK